MSLINQMLQDLEQRRTAEAGVSPLGGLSSSGSGARPTNPINYFLLGMVLVLVVLVAAVTSYLFGANNSPVLPGQIPQTLPQQSMVSPKKESTPVLQLKAKTALAENKGVENKRVENNAPRIAEKVTPQKKATVKKEPILSKKIGTEGKAISVELELAKPEPAISVAATEQPVKPEPAAEIKKHIRPLTRMQQAQVAFQAAVKYIGRGKNQDAHDALNKALSLAPTHSRAREMLAASLLNVGRITEAAATLREGLSLQPKTASLAKLYARILVDQDDLGNAVAVLERARSSAIGDADYQALLAALYQRTGKHAQAAQSYRHVLQVRPNVASWWMGLALSLEPMGQTGDALNAYHRALKAGGLSTDVSQFVMKRIEALTLVSLDPEAEAIEE